MKKTVSVNIGSMAFTLDEDAYGVLRDYLDDIRARLPEGERAEVLDDVESRLAEILRERMPVSGQVVDLKLVRGAMATIGEADCFGERRTGAEYDRELFGEYADGPAPRKLYRARVDRVLAGVCSGIARYFGWDPTLVRVAMVVLAIVTVSAAFWAYIILWIVVPEQPLDRRVFNDIKKGRR